MTATYICIVHTWHNTIYCLWKKYNTFRWGGMQQTTSETNRKWQLHQQSHLFMWCDWLKLDACVHTCAGTDKSVGIHTTTDTFSTIVSSIRIAPRNGLHMSNTKGISSSNTACCFYLSNALLACSDYAIHIGLGYCRPLLFILSAVTVHKHKPPMVSERIFAPYRHATLVY